MAQQSLTVIESSLQKTHEWLRDIMDGLRLDNRHDAYVILRGVLHALRDRLPLDSAVKLGAQLPLIIKGIYYDEWIPKEAPLKIRQPEEFIELVSDYINNAKLSPLSLDAIIHVMHVIGTHIMPHELIKISKLFPEKIRTAIFPEHAFHAVV